MRLGDREVLAAHHFMQVADERHDIVNGWLPCQTSTLVLAGLAVCEDIQRGPRSNPMKIHEYQAKALLAKYGVPVPRGEVAETVDQAVEAARKLGGKVVVKAQIHAGGRGKGGGVKLAADPSETEHVAGQILGMTLVTHQTGPEGRLVQKVLVEETLPIAKELYAGLVLDRA